MERKKAKKRPGNNRRATIDLRDIEEHKRPEIAVYAVDRSRKVIATADVDDKGQFQISEKVLQEAHQVIIGPQVEDIGTIERDKLTIYRASQIKQVLDDNGVLVIPKQKWYSWFLFWRCVHGTVTHCFPYPWVVSDLVRQVQLAQASISLSETILSDAKIALPTPRRIFPYRCETVCDGVVEVYRRICCCHPWIIYDPRLPELLEELEHVVEELPPIPWPPEPDPDPLPIHALPIFKHGALDERALRANTDLQAIRSLAPAELPAYINARPYLLCHCGSATQVAHGFIQPDGEFNICWHEWPQLMTINCHEEYAYVVKQVINGSLVTIYDGLAANKWFHYGDSADLVSHHLQAQSCRNNDFPGEGAFALLQDIGLMPSYKLKTPDATGWDRVATPVYNDGLAHPAANAAAAKGKYLDRNWGGKLLLRYHFSESMRGVGAKYYRVSVVAANANGNPTGTRSYLSPNEWRYYTFVGMTPHVEKVSLGPHSAGSQNDLYEIPYDADRAWHSGQYHAILKTNDFPNGRFLLTVEVFDNAGNLLRPTGTPNPGGSVVAAFTYRRWYQEVGPTAEVPFAALTHMLWWDNRKAKAKIVDLRVNGAANTAQCQFLVAAGSANFSVGYRAYHQEPMFMLDHRIWWRRGLGGPSGILTSPHPNPDNVGVPPALPHQSGSNSFSTMLAGLSNPKCSFSANLHVNVKTYNGIGTLDGLDAWDQAAFALEMIP